MALRRGKLRTFDPTPPPQPLFDGMAATWHEHCFAPIPNKTRNPKQVLHIRICRTHPLVAETQHPTNFLKIPKKNPAEAGLKGSRSRQGEANAQLLAHPPRVSVH